MDKAPGILNNAYLQGGVVLLFIAVLLLMVVGIFYYVVRPLWRDLQDSRARERQMTERVVVMGEAQRATNNTVAHSLDSVAKELAAVEVRISESTRTAAANHEAATSQRNEIIGRLYGARQ